MKRLIFHDTTLRDGDQTPGVNFTVSQKVEIARALCRAKVDAIEAGFAAASPGDARAIRSVAAAVGESAVVTSLARATKADIDAAAEALKDAARGRIHVFLSTSPVHMEHKLKMTPEEVLENTETAVAYAKSLGFEVQFSAEDATRSDRAFLREVLLAARKAGADILNVPDTVGVSAPEEFYDLIRFFTQDPAFDGAVFSVHCHNDLGLAVANSLAGVRAGALQVECTATGIGERAGNAALEQIALGVRTRADLYPVTLGLDTRALMALSRKVSELAGMPIALNAPIIGQNAFVHESGIHQHGMLQNNATYQILDPKDVGRDEAKLLLGKLSGRAAFKKKAKELGYVLEKEAMERAFSAFLQLADRKNLVRDEEVDAILAEVRDEEILSHGYELTAFSIQSNSGGMASADISLKKDGRILRDAATGSGPIEAAFHAVERITETHFNLDAYRIRAVTEGRDALGIVLVRLKEGEQIYSGRGVSVDIIEASVKAYVSAVNRAIYYTEEAHG